MSELIPRTVARRICILARVVPGAYPQTCTAVTPFPEEGTPSYKYRTARLEWDGTPMTQCEGHVTWLAEKQPVCDHHAGLICLQQMARAQEI